MSEALSGMPPPPPPAALRDAAATVLFRRTSSGAEIFWLKREKTLRFAGGFYAFPGGKVDKADGDLVVTAARELFEETGVLKARGVERLTQAVLDDERRALLNETRSFHDILSTHGLTLEPADFMPAGRWRTPPFMPVGRFDARFFLVEAPTSHVAVVWPGELAEGAWISPHEALRRWSEGSALLHPPNLHAVRVMASFTTVEAALDSLRNPPHVDDFVAHRLEFQRGIHLVPLRTPTLPPATHTNAYVLGTKELLVVDPGSPDDAEQAHLLSVLKGMKQEGCSVVAVIATHHHGDHVGGIEAVSRALNVPVWAHADTASRLSVPVARLLRDGDELQLDGPLPMTWRVLHTPGHARGHVVLVDTASTAAVVGDMVAGVGTIVIDPPEGDMAEYLRQLKRLAALPVGTIYPAHGPAIPTGVDKLEEYVAHRTWREGKVISALSTFTSGATVEELVPLAYDDVQAFVWPIAERNTLAILEKLVAEGRATRAGERFRPTA